MDPTRGGGEKVLRLKKKNVFPLTGRLFQNLKLTRSTDEKKKINPVVID